MPRLGRQLHGDADVFDDHRQESAGVARHAVDAATGVLQDLLEGYCGLGQALGQFSIPVFNRIKLKFIRDILTHLDIS